jgi:photosystem II stability/assembly factor-like uncharacterized protein
MKEYTKGVLRKPIGFIYVSIVLVGLMSVSYATWSADCAYAKKDTAFLCWHDGASQSIVVKTMDGGNSWSGWRFLGANVLGLHGKPTEWRTKLIGCGSGDNPGGYIFRTTDGGSTWNCTKVDCATNILTKVDYGNSRAIAVGWSGNIIKSTDDGQNWHSCNSNTTVVINDIDYYWVGTIGYAAGYNGVILKTEDEGENWTIKPSGVTNTLRGISFGWFPYLGAVVGSSRFIKRSIDYGETWNNVSISGGSTNDDLYDVMLDGAAEVGIAVGYNGAMYRTTDECVTWNRVYHGLTSEYLRAVSECRQNTIWVIGDNLTCLKSDNSGQNWTLKTVDISNLINVGIEELPALNTKDHLILDGRSIGRNSFELNYAIPEAASVRLCFYNLKGQLVRTLESYSGPSGHGAVIWNCNDEKGKRVPAGIYFCNMKVNNRTVISKKLVKLE